MKTTNKYITMAPLFLVLVIDTMGAGIIFPVLGPLFMQKHDSILPIAATLAQRQLWYGITLTSWALLMFIGAPFLGDLSDRMGRKKVLMLSLIGSTVGFLLSGLGIELHSLGVLIVGRLLAGFFAGSQPIAQAVIADISPDENKVLFISLIIVANCLGFIIGPIVGGYFADPDIVSWFSYGIPFFAAGLFSLINASLLLITLKETYQPKPDVELNLAKGLMTVAEAFTSKKIRVHSLILFFHQLAWCIFFLYGPIYLVEHLGYDNLNIAHYMSFMGAVFVLGLTAVIRILVKFMRLDYIVVFMAALMGLGCLLIQDADGYAFWWLSIPIAFGNGIGYSVLITLCSNRVLQEQQGWVMGITSSIVAAAFSCGSILAGTLGTFGQLFPFYVSAVLSFVSALIMIWQSLPGYERAKSIRQV